MSKGRTRYPATGIIMYCIVKLYSVCSFILIMLSSSFEIPISIVDFISTILLTVTPLTKVDSGSQLKK